MEKEDLDDEPYDDEDDDVEYPEFSLGDLEKLASGQGQRLFIEKVTVTDFAALVEWAEEREMAIEIEDCLLNGTQVQGARVDMSFDDVSFMERLDCANGTFRGQLRFCETGFSESVDFGSAVFEKQVIFEECDFEKNITLAGSHFKGSVCFENTEFHGTAVFDGARFDGKADFRYVTFNKPASFNNAFFEKGVNLWKTYFEQGVDKTGSNMDRIVEESPSVEEGADTDVR